MKRNKLMLIICALLIISTQSQAQTKKIPFTVARHYFISGEIPDGEIVFPKITSKEQFNKIFEMATTMGKDGKPTAIDFSKQFVIAALDVKSNNTNEFSPLSLTENDGIITLLYKKTYNKTKSSSYYRIPIILIVNKKYEDADIRIVQTSEKEIIPYTLADHYFVNNTVEKGLIPLPEITSKEQFQKYFGMATVMGKDGKPTAIDFSKQFVAAIINTSTKYYSKMDVRSVIAEGGIISLTYQVKNFTHQGQNVEKENSYRSCLIIILDNKYKGNINFVSEKRI